MSRGMVIAIIYSVKGCDALSLRMDIIMNFSSLSFMFINSSTWLIMSIADGGRFVCS